MSQPDSSESSGRQQEDKMVRTVGIIGAGFAGLVTAKVLKDFGFEPHVFESDSEVGGVWAASRRYPGLTTQNVRSTYALSDFPYPKSYPEWPSGQQVQEYMASYADHFKLNPLISMNTKVESATFDESANQWAITTSGSESGTKHYDYLVVCNGIFSDPAIPDWPGAHDFTAAGGQILHTSDFHDLNMAKDKNVVVVGFGKSSCDVAAATVGTSASTTIVARKIIWKIPKKFKNVLNYKMLMLTRMGEALFPYIDRHGVEKFMHGSGKAVSKSMLGSVQGVVTSQFKLNEIDLNPNTGLDTIVRSTVSLASDNFFDYVKNGQLTVERDTEIVQCEAGQVRLASGKTLPADLLICGTGFHQRVPFFDESMMKRVTDEKGNFQLYRQILPLNTPALAFNGYNSSFFSQLNAEAGAWWIASNLSGMLTLPSEEEQRAHTERRLAWMEERTEGKHSKGTNIIPFSIHNVDELLDDLNLSIGSFKRFREWLLPINPKDYAPLEGKLIKRRDSMVAK
jgi:dimethylaniline monooxygenase (N-oxide forming)